jgi:hypothetical protein
MFDNDAGNKSLSEMILLARVRRTKQTNGPFVMRAYLLLLD